MKSKKQLAIEALVVWCLIFFVLEVVLVWLDGSNQAWFSNGIRNTTWIVLIILFTLINIFYDPKKNEDGYGKVDDAPQDNESSKTNREERLKPASKTTSDGDKIGLKIPNTSTVFDLSNHPIGSEEFKLEIVSAAAHSELSFLEFAKKYDLDPVLLKSWIVEYLGPDGADSEDTELAELDTARALDLEEYSGVTQQARITVDQTASNNRLHPQVAGSTSSVTIGSRSLWLNENQNISDRPKGVFAMSITNFQVEGPDDDGDISLEIEFKLENSSKTEITLVKKNLVLEQSKVGALAGEVNDKEECLLDPGDSLQVSTWTRVNKNCFDQSDKSIDVKFFTSFYSSEFFKFTDIEVPNKANQITSIIENVSSELLEPSIKISIMRIQEVPYDEGEDDPEEDKLEIKISLENKSSIYMEDIEANLALMARNGAEIEATSDQLEVLAPHSGALLQPSFWGIKRSKLRDAKINLSIKTNKLVGTQILRETKAWTS